MEKKKMICFDMDGTIANLFAVPDWLPKLRAYDPTPYAEAAPMWDMEALALVLEMLKLNGWEIAVITWLSKESTPEYDAAVRRVKRDWLERYNVPYDSFHGVKYGRTKADSVRKRCAYGILIDDNETICAGWTLGATINPTKENIIEKLLSLL